MTIPIGGSNKTAAEDHEHFLRQSAKLFEHLLKDRKTLHANLKKTPYSLMDTLMKKNKR